MVPGDQLTPLIKLEGGGGQGKQLNMSCFQLHSGYVQFSLKSLFLLYLFCWRSLSGYKKGSYGTKHSPVKEGRLSSSVLGLTPFVVLLVPIYVNRHGAALAACQFLSIGTG
jgi:hypothetical protein